MDGMREIQNNAATFKTTEAAAQKGTRKTISKKKTEILFVPNICVTDLCFPIETAIKCK